MQIISNKKEKIIADEKKDIRWPMDISRKDFCGWKFVKEAKIICIDSCKKSLKHDMRGVQE